MDIKDLSISKQHLKILEAHYFRKNTKILADAILNDPTILESKFMRELVSEIVSGDYKPMKRYVTEAAYRRNRYAMGRIVYYIAMGIKPTKGESNYDDNRICVCDLVADDLVSSGFKKISANTVYKEIYIPSRDRKDDPITRLQLAGLQLQAAKTEGEMIYRLNANKAPETRRDIEELERKWAEQM